MQLSHTARIRLRKAQGMLVLLLISSSFLLSACGGNPQVRQEADSAQTRFMQKLQQAQEIGVPTPFLHKILQQQQQLLTSSAPFNLFGLSDDQATDSYYRNLATRYTQLTSQIGTAITASTAQAQKKTQHDLQTAQQALQAGQTQNLPVQRLSQELAQAQAGVPKAKIPRDYQRISEKAQNIQESLALMKNISSSLNGLNQTIDLLQRAKLDVTALRMSYQKDKSALEQETTVTGFRSLQARVRAQTQQALTTMTQAIPALVTAKINAFSQQLQNLQKEGVNTKVYQTHQKKLQQARALIHDHMSIQEYEIFATQIDKDTTAALFDELHAHAQKTLQQFHKDTESWSTTNAYYNSYDGKKYPLNAGYLDQGIGDDLDAALTQASSVDDLKKVNSAINDAQFNFQLLKSNYHDSTPYNQAHQTDIQALDRYKLQKGQVIVVSMTEQALRLYQDGRLVRAFLTTTGRYERPSVPGLWSSLSRLSPTMFHSPDPPGSPYWYSPTPIQHAILYREGGYFIHDSSWRYTYGPGTQFPHADASGNHGFADNGSHGCINLRANEAAWLYNNTSWKTAIIVY